MKAFFLKALRPKASLLIVSIMGCCPLLAHAQDASTQPTAIADSTVDTNEPPANGPGNPGGSTDDPRGHHRGMYPRINQRVNQQLTEKELEDARKFMAEHSPQRLKALEAMPDGEEKNRIRTGAALAYLNWMRLANTDTKLYAVIVKRVDLEDQIFGKFFQMQMDPADKRDADKADLKGLVSQLVDNGIQEREIRLAKLKKALEVERKNLDHDEDPANRPQVVEDGLKRILDTEGGGLLPNAGPGAGPGGDKHPHAGPHENP